MATIEQTVFELAESEKVEFGTLKPRRTGETVSKVVVASYNIRYAVGRYLISSGLLRRTGLLRTKHRSQRVAQNIRTAAKAFSAGQVLPAVDILALQEADKETGRAGRHHIARELAEELGMSWVHVPAGLSRGVAPQKRQWWLDFEEQIDLFDPGDTGVALLSHFPIQDVMRIDLPWTECAWRPRLAVGATIRLGHADLRLFNSHIDPHSAASGQIEQLEVVLEQARQSSMPTIVVGDFNTLSNRKCFETRRVLESEGYKTPFPTGTATWRGAGIRLHADWIFVRGLKITRWGVAKPLSVSDHWPIWAEIHLGKE
ncbi:MAG TPA: endonuclease/exonuclease/phosphatase family protein [Pyrinomonadaceae bacterium]|nr:endonuclease/exonuclease/phosphatase family protein [Pyrinomonadaceae bacterium]